MKSRFLDEIPNELTDSVNDAGDPVGMGLFAERREVRETVKKNLFTGKTYNSIDNISQFFSERGMPPPRGLSGNHRPQAAPATMNPGAQARPPQAAPKPAPQPAPPAQAKPGGGKLLQMPLIPMQDSGSVAQRPPTRPPQQVPQPASQTASQQPRFGSPPPPLAQMRPKTGGKKTFGPGSVVEHPRYGRGTVLRREGEGEDAKLTISFPGHGLKKLVERFAGLNTES